VLATISKLKLPKSKDLIINTSKFADCCQCPSNVSSHLRQLGSAGEVCEKARSSHTVLEDIRWRSVSLWEPERKVPGSELISLLYLDGLI